MTSIYFSDNWLAFLQDTFGWRVQHINIGGGAPIPVIVKRRLGGSKIASTLPFAHALPQIDLENAEALRVELRRLGVNDFNYHGEIANSEVAVYSNNSIIEIDLSRFTNSDDLFRSFSKDSIQRKIRRAQQSGMKVELLTSDRDFSKFQELQSNTRKRQGAPTYPNNFFLKLREHLASNGLISLYGIFNPKAQLVSGIITYNFQKTTVYAYGASIAEDELVRSGANQLCMWESIRQALQEGATLFDFGSTPNHHRTLLDYKLKWASKIRKLEYTFFSLEAKGPYIIDRQSRSALLLETAIKRMPDPVFRWATPILLKAAVY